MTEFQWIVLPAAVVGAVAGYFLGRWDGYYSGRKAAGKWWANKILEEAEKRMVEREKHHG